MWDPVFKPFLERIRHNECSHVHVILSDEPFIPSAKNRKPLSTWEGHTDVVRELTVLPDGTVVSGSQDETLRRWAPRTCLLPTSIESHKQ